MVLGLYPAFEFELTVLNQDEEGMEVRAEAWIADQEGVVWTAGRTFEIGDLLSRAAPLLSPAVHESKLADRDRASFDERPLVSGAECYLSHAHPGRLIIGSSVWRGGDVWIVPKHFAATVDIAAPDLSTPVPDPKLAYFTRLSGPLLIRVREATPVSTDESEWKAPPFVYAMSALDLVGGLGDHWRPTSVRAAPQPIIEFSSAAG